ncbi:N-6 adenine-specific DNA methyltransferase-like protein 2 [Zopfochytrium polystomum]|nr:N-6 adenine-specific DNA methyltransferase-like protein 2 [Zopfochytrium polystomum]
MQKTETEEKFNELKRLAHERADAAALARRMELLAIDDFGEDWQLSQFWYDDDTATKLAEEAIAITPPGGRIACVSAPSAFVALFKLLNAATGTTTGTDSPEKPTATLLEYDRRFDVYGDAFVFFDFNRPTDLDERDGARPLHGRFDTVIADPPFLNEECWSKTAECVRWLGKAGKGGSESGDGVGAKVIVCTGAVMREHIAKELGCHATEFRPRHKGDRLSNEFGCFINYESERFKKRVE